MVTGVLSIIFLILCLLFLVRRKIKFFNMKVHCIFGYLFLMFTLIHINIQIVNPHISTGFLTLLFLLIVTITGILRRHYMKIKMLYTVHILFVVIFLLSLLVHIINQFINLVMM